MYVSIILYNWKVFKVFAIGEKKTIIIETIKDLILDLQMISSMKLRKISS